jgi:hypothetical protein
MSLFGHKLPSRTKKRKQEKAAQTKKVAFTEDVTQIPTRVAKVVQPPGGPITAPAETTAPPESVFRPPRRAGGLVTDGPALAGTNRTDAAATPEVAILRPPRRAGGFTGTGGSTLTKAKRPEATATAEGGISRPPRRAGGFTGTGGSTATTTKRADATRVPDVNRKLPDETAKDLQDIRKRTDTAEVGSRLAAEHDALQRIGSVLSAAEWATEVRKYSERVRAIKGLLPEVVRLIEELPLRRAEFLDLLMAVNGPEGAKALSQLVLLEHVAATDRCATAVERIERIAADDLSALSLQDKLSLLQDLRGGGLFGSQDRRKAAMAKLYLHTELDPAFAADDDKQRADALAEIRAVLEPEDRKWATMPQDERLDALTLALEIHSDYMNIPDSERATIVIGSNLTRTLADGQKVTLGGAFNYGTRTIEISSAFLGHFDRILDTAIHENTHNHQRWLVKQLEQGAIKSDDKRYRQVALFALNQSVVGYHQSGTGLLPKDEDDSAYEKQPTELHAHRAGADAARTMKENAKARAADLMRRMDDWTQNNPAGRNRTGVADRRNQLQDYVNRNESSTTLHSEVARLERDFATLTAPSDKEQLVTQVTQWLANNPKSSNRSQVEGILTSATTASAGKIRSLKDMFELATSNG